MTKKYRVIDAREDGTIVLMPLDDTPLFRSQYFGGKEVTPNVYDWGIHEDEDLTILHPELDSVLDVTLSGIWMSVGESVGE